MTPDEALAQHRAFLTELGKTVSIRRYTGPAGPDRPYTDTATIARVVGYAPQFIGGTIIQGDRKAIVLAEPLASILPVLDTDKLVVGGKELEIRGPDISTRSIAGTLIALELQVRG